MDCQKTGAGFCALDAQTMVDCVSSDSWQMAQKNLEDVSQVTVNYVSGYQMRPFDSVLREKKKQTKIFVQKPAVLVQEFSCHVVTFS